MLYSSTFVCTYYIANPFGTFLFLFYYYYRNNTPGKNDKFLTLYNIYVHI
jgi:hypothetical protein